ncbi:MAG: sulfite dehydrogenase, partial [Gammaproteobacteria bacterium]|nr:sulfite dehydrogenase [Gammaproteobacteria bacterium]
MTSNNKSLYLTPVAGNGLLDRRLFLQSGLILGAAQLVAGSAQAARRETAARPEWMSVPGEPFTLYGQPAQFEEDVVRYPAPNRVLRNNGASWTPLHRL